MMLDVILAAVVLVMAVYGYRKGFVKQAFVLAGVLAVVFGAAPMADIFEEILAREFDMALTGRYVRGFLLAGCSATLYILAQAASAFLHKTLISGITLAEKTNHILGTVLSVITSTLAIYFVLCVISAGIGKIEEYAPSAHRFITSSRSYKAAHENNHVRNFNFFAQADPEAPEPGSGDAPEQSSPPESRDAGKARDTGEGQETSDTARNTSVRAKDGDSEPETKTLRDIK